MPLARVEDAISAIGRGEIVVVVDDEDRENEGDLIMAAEAATPEKIAFFLSHTSGLICAPLTGERCDELGRRDVLQVLVEGGATVAGAFHRAGLVDRYIVYLAPVLFGGDDATPLFTGPGAATMADVWRGRIESVTQLGDDLKVVLCSQG